VTPKTSFEKFRRWSARHIGLICLFGSLITVLFAVWTRIESYIETQVRSSKMAEIERKLEKYEAETEAKTVSNLSLQNDLREIKGYIRGVSDKNLQEVVEKNLLLKYEENQNK